MKLKKAIPYYLTDKVPAFEDNVTKEEKTHALNKSEKTPVDVKESFEEVLENNTKTSTSFSDNQKTRSQTTRAIQIDIFLITTSTIISLNAL